MGKLLYNCAVSPREDKYRRIKLTNKRLAETLGSDPAALEALTALGWVADPANAQELIVPDGLYFTMKEVSVAVVPGKGLGCGNEGRYEALMPQEQQAGFPVCRQRAAGMGVLTQGLRVMGGR